MASYLSLCLVLLAGFSAVLCSTPATIEEYPSLVQVELSGALISVQMCSGSIITEVHVLSAARCFMGPLVSGRTRRIRAGATNRGRDGTTIRIMNFINHPDFGSNRLDADITVVRLESSLVFGSTIQRAAIIAQDFALPAYLPVVHAGWGSTAQDSIWANRQLYSVDMRTVSHSDCVDQYASLPVPLPVTDNMICAGVNPDGGISHDVRDGGGAIYYDGIIVGVVSMGLPVIDSYPVVATDVASFSDWIVSIAV